MPLYPWNSTQKILEMNIRRARFSVKLRTNIWNVTCDELHCSCLHNLILLCLKRKSAQNDYLVPLLSLRKKYSYWVFWSVFSHIRTEYWEISPYSVPMKEHITLNTDTFHALVDFRNIQCINLLPLILD